MASGHVNRTQRPNTWLHRPSLRREDSPCQLGAVHTWPIASFRCHVAVRVACRSEADMIRRTKSVRSVENDPHRPFAARVRCSAGTGSVQLSRLPRRRLVPFSFVALYFTGSVRNRSFAGISDGSSITATEACCPSNIRRRLSIALVTSSLNFVAI